RGLAGAGGRGRGGGAGGRRRRGGGPPAWQLAVRRLQLDNATTVRAVAAISVAVSGAIALQMVFTAAEHRFTARADTAIPTGAEAGTTRLLIQTETPGSTATPLGQRLAGVAGVGRVWSFASGTVSSAEQAGGATDNGLTGGLAVASCATLRTLATLPSCADGDVFLAAEPVAGPHGAMPGAPPLSTDPTAAGWLPAPGGVLPGPGTRVTLGTPGAESLGAWTIPAGARTVPALPRSPSYTAVLATPGALPSGVLDALTVTAYADLPDDLPDGLDRVQNAVAAVDPFATVYGRDADLVLPLFGQVRMVMYVGIVAVLALIGASLLVGIVEQLRERRRVLAVLVAFGARGRTLAASVLWQTAVPMALGVTVAVGVGMGLGSALLRLVGLPTSFDWVNIATVAATAVGAVLVTTAASLPVLRRLMRPDGLRSE
ncbi:FtsX-like permease family protein, partial [Frankia sp. AgW1.1]|uniref:FtsX-like permease family protein n=1 Tax=Frankia sp. AgW1.1 TaxID=1836971 RepID=UPI0019341A8D